MRIYLQLGPAPYLRGITKDGGIPKPDFVLSNLDDAEKWGFHAACSLGKPIPLQGRRPGRITGHKGIYVVVNMAERSDYDRL
jgi:hypothetical protein